MLSLLFRALYVGAMLLFFVPTASANVDITVPPIASQNTVLRAVAKSGALESPNLKGVCFGLVLGVAAMLVAAILWNASHLKRSVWLGHLLFVLTGAFSLSFVLFLENVKIYTDNPTFYFHFLIRFQLVLSSVVIFSLLNASGTKTKIGSIFSALLGGVLGASLLEFFWSIDTFLFINQMVLILASIALGGRQFLNESSKTLFFHLLIAVIMGFIVCWMPDLKRLASEAYSFFAILELFVLAATAASLFTTIDDLTTDKFARLKREIYNAEQRLSKQQQIVQLLQADCQTLEEQLQQEAKFHRQDEMRDELKIKALEEMSQDIAHGMVTYLKELEYGCSQIMTETKSPKYRLHRIRAFAERSLLIATKVQDVMTFIQRNDEGEVGKLVNAGDLLKECLRLCHEKIVRSSVEIEIDSYDNELWLEGRVTLLAQGFLGLLYNALEATESSDVRRVTIRLCRIEAQGSKWVELAVSNSGAGIPTAIKAKVFHSRIREGLGVHSLGLSMAFGVFESFGGSLNLDNDAVATTFLARLPLYTKDEEFSLRLAV